MMIPIIITTTLYFLLALPVFVCLYNLIRIDSNKLFIRTLKIYISIIASVKVIQILMNFVMTYIFTYSTEIKYYSSISRYTAIISNFIITPLVLIGVLVLLYGVYKLKESGGKND